MTTRRYLLTGALVGLAMIGANGMVTDGQLAGPSALLSAVRSAQPEDDDFGALAAAALDATADDRARLADILRRGSEAQRTAALFALADSGGDDAIAMLEIHPAGSPRGQARDGRDVHLGLVAGRAADVGRARATA